MKKVYDVVLITYGKLGIEPTLEPPKKVVQTCKTKKEAKRVYSMMRSEWHTFEIVERDIK